METVNQKTKGQIDDEHSEVGRSKGTRRAEKTQEEDDKTNSAERQHQKKKMQG